MSTETYDYLQLHRPMTERLVALASSLSDTQWTSPSLCDGWRVCDVYGHMTYHRQPSHRSDSIVNTWFRQMIPNTPDSVFSVGILAQPVRAEARSQMTEMSS